MVAMADTLPVSEDDSIYLYIKRREVYETKDRDAEGFWRPFDDLSSVHRLKAENPKRGGERGGAACTPECSHASISTLQASTSLAALPGHYHH